MNDGIVSECCIGRADCRCEEEMVGGGGGAETERTGQHRRGHFRVEMDRKLKGGKEEGLDERS